MCVVKRFTSTFLIFFYLLSSVISLAGSGKTSFYANIVISSKNTTKRHIETKSFKILKHTLPIAQSKTDSNIPLSGDDATISLTLKGFIVIENNNEHHSLYVNKPFNKAPPLV